MAAQAQGLTAALAGVAADFEDLGWRFALVGGLAVSARAEPRTTRDVDVAVAVADDAEAEATLFELQQLGYRLVMLLEQTRARRLATARLHTPVSRGADVIVDLLFAASGIEPEVVRAAERIEVLPGLTLPVARVGHLLAMKMVSRGKRRPQDDADIRALLAVAGAADRRTARRALALVERRGMARGRDLQRAFASLARLGSRADGVGSGLRQRLPSRS